ncbi:MAG: hypothetical protein MUE99_07575 [Chitinophagaceae bacterium]|jgi:hypothetical protein|nr:hypothetical protein [Chitinophagaceae bacterium]
MKKILTTSLTLLIVCVVFAQGFQPIDNYMKNNGNSGSEISTMNSRNVSGTELKSLAYDLHPTLFFSNGALTQRYKETKQPETIQSDAASLGSVARTNASLLRDVKLLKVSLNQPGELGSTFNANLFKVLPNVKYILVETSFNCSEAQLNKMIPEAAGKEIVWVYNVSSDQ